MAFLEAALGAAAFVLAFWVWTQLALRALALTPPMPSWRFATMALAEVLFGKTISNNYAPEVVTTGRAHWDDDTSSADAPDIGLKYFFNAACAAVMAYASRTSQAMPSPLLQRTPGKNLLSSLSPAAPPNMGHPGTASTFAQSAEAQAGGPRSEVRSQPKWKDQTQEVLEVLAKTLTAADDTRLADGGDSASDDTFDTESKMCKDTQCDRVLAHAEDDTPLGHSNEASTAVKDSSSIPPASALSGGSGAAASDDHPPESSGLPAAEAPRRWTRASATTSASSGGARQPAAEDGADSEAPESCRRTAEAGADTEAKKKSRKQRRDAAQDLEGPLERAGMALSVVAESESKQPETLTSTATVPESLALSIVAETQRITPLELKELETRRPDAVAGHSCSAAAAATSSEKQHELPDHWLTASSPNMSTQSKLSVREHLPLHPEAVPATDSEGETSQSWPVAAAQGAETLPESRPDTPGSSVCSITAWQEAKLESSEASACQVGKKASLPDASSNAGLANRRKKLVSKAIVKYAVPATSPAASSLHQPSSPKASREPSAARSGAKPMASAVSSAAGAGNRPVVVLRRGEKVQLDTAFFATVPALAPPIENSGARHFENRNKKEEAGVQKEPPVRAHPCYQDDSYEKRRFPSLSPTSETLSSASAPGLPSSPAELSEREAPVVQFDDNVAASAQPSPAQLTWRPSLRPMAGAGSGASAASSSGNTTSPQRLAAASAKSSGAATEISAPRKVRRSFYNLRDTQENMLARTVREEQG